MANGKNLLGGRSGSGPHKINSDHTTFSRQRKREHERRTALKIIRKKFQGIGRSGTPAWNEEMPRRIARAIAFEMARKHRTENQAA